MHLPPISLLEMTCGVLSVEFRIQNILVSQSAVKTKNWWRAVGAAYQSRFQAISATVPQRLRDVVHVVNVNPALDYCGDFEANQQQLSNDK